MTIEEIVTSLKAVEKQLGSIEVNESIEDNVNDASNSLSDAIDSLEEIQ